MMHTDDPKRANRYLCREKKGVAGKMKMQSYSIEVEMFRWQDNMSTT